MRRAKETHSRAPSLFEQDAAPAARAEPALFARVALNRPLPTEYTYAVPEGLAPLVRAGSRVVVPLGAERQVGVVVDVPGSTDVPRRKLRDLLEVLDPEPLVPPELLQLSRWIAERYASSWGEALAAVLPAALKREGGLRQVLTARPVPGVGASELAALEGKAPQQHRLLRTLLEIGAPAELRKLLHALNLSYSQANGLARRGLIVLENADARADGLSSVRGSERARPERLSPAQERAVAAIARHVQAGTPATILLEGVTGSGKTEVYLRVIEQALALGRAAIVLVPEIALTPQTVGWFRSRFEDVSVLHSRMSESRRLETWKRLKSGASRVVVGARSAVFAPVPGLGVIVVDEEHEPSFKQGSVPRYHARDVAIERCRRSGAVCILGSATPALESWHAAETGVFERLELPQRVGGGTPPAIEIVDMRCESERGKHAPVFSRLLRFLLQEALESQEQAILLLNRRGFVPVLWCPGCENTVRCHQCDMSLTYHRRIRRLVCHGCCEERAIMPACPTCSRPDLRFYGVGSERVEAELKALLPAAVVRRMDSDTMRTLEDYEDTLERFGRREIDVLVGTQMIAKGLDFPRVTVVGIVSADLALHLPDFRASERTYQLVAQVAGRAGRGDLPGRIVVQTNAPEHPAIRFAAQGDFGAFARHEQGLRAELGYPPFGRLVRIVIEGQDEQRVEEAGRACAERLRQAFGGPGLELLGPAPAPISTLRGRHRAHVVVKATGPDADARIVGLVSAARGLALAESRLRIAIDVDPISML